MEGTRNERVALLVTAYVIGFTTAFIAYGLTQNVNPSIVDATNLTSNTQTAIVATATPTTEPETYYPKLRTDSTGLYLDTADQKQILLAYQATEETASQPGVYYKVIGAALSPNKEYVYFCEQRSPEAETCIPYVYSILEDVVYPVRTNAEDMNYSIQSHNIGWSDENELVAQE